MDLAALLQPADASDQQPHLTSSYYDGSSADETAGPAASTVHEESWIHHQPLQAHSLSQAAPPAAQIAAPAAAPVALPQLSAAASPAPAKKSKKKATTAAVPQDHVDPDWLQDAAAIRAEEDIALLQFPHVVNPYLAHIAASTIQSRNLGVQAFARATQDGITTTSEHLAQQWETASAPSSIRDNLLQALHHVEDIPLPAQPTPGGSLGPQALTAPLLAARNFSTSSVGGGAGGEASTSTSVTGDYNTLTPEERAARKTEIAKEGWRKRRLNAQEKKESDSAKRQKGLEAAARKRESRRNAAEKLKAAKAQAQQQQMQEAQEALLAMQQLPPQQQQPISEADMTIPASMAEDVKPFEQAAILNGQGHPQQPSLNRDSDTLDFDSHLSRKRAVSASSSVNGSTVNTGKRARLSPSVDVKQETVEPSMQLPLPVSPALPLPSPFVQPQQALLPHMQASPSLPPPSVLEPPPQTSPALPAPITAKPDLASTAAAAAAAAARSKSDYERKVWATIARSSIPKVIRAQQQGLVSRQTFHKRLSGAAAREGKKYNTKNVKPLKDLQIKARRVMREMLLHLKGSEKSQKETKRKQDKEVLEKSRKEEEAREAQRAARKLNFLITQTELYSHFVGSKLKTSEAEDSAETAGTSAANQNGAPPLPPEGGLISQLANTDAPSASELAALDFNNEDDTNMLSHARRNAEAAAQLAKEKARMFDETFKSEQAASKENYLLGEDGDEEMQDATTPNGGDAAMDSLTAKASSGQLNQINIDDMNFQNPTMAANVPLVTQPSMLTCTMKDYQLKGLNWLANLYEQGINGILADEMGLGKTVQSISLMAYLAEQHNIWGPFLVVAPASTLHNWQQEITKFAPALKVLPYWGNVKDRTTLRKFWNRKSLRYDRNAPFHVLITSYQLVVTDEQYFNKVKWQYMVLDEAQAIKSSSSSRWRILLGMNCRNRLLLTGTPIQNSMQELWALLHFIMPSLFDSHNEFSDWFAKDIEGNADKNGAMNEHQLRRLHMILKPFMLRRIKKNVQNELADKIEIDVYCDLTTRQRHMYRTLRQNISLTDLVARASSLSDDESVKRLMNLIMQFRKVCNHPELFERADVTAPFSFSDFNQSYSLNREGNKLDVQYSTNSYLDIKLPRLVYEDRPMAKLEETSHIAQLMSIWSPNHLATSADRKDSAFAAMKLAELDPNTVHTLSRSRDPVARLEVAKNAIENDKIALTQAQISGLPFRKQSVKIRQSIPDDPTWRYLGLPPLAAVQDDFRQYSRFNRSDIRFYIDEATAPPASLTCSSREFAYKQNDMLYDQSTRAALYGAPGENNGVLTALDKSQLPLAPMEVPQLHKLILESGKLAKLDELLVTLKQGGHRVLVYFQMTRMIDLMEEYLAFRQYKYLRLDGSSSISERRDMVSDWQSKPEIFIFLLSTRAGGLGINLTAADTVIFYDSDWNPSNDAQAMDRAHRLGQTRQVTVYRLITKNTIDERILQLARTKKSVQDAVVGSSTQVVGGAVSASGDVKSNEVVSLLLDDDELAESIRQSEANKAKQEAKMIDNGKKGAKAREENKKAREIAAAAKKQGLANGGGSMLGPGQGWGMQDDDEDAFGFFSSAKGKGAAGDDDMDAEGDDDAEGEVEGGSTAKPAAKGKGKGKAKAKSEPADPNAPPKKKRAPAVRKPPELGPDGQPIKKPRKPKAKKVEPPAAL